ncbi:MAG: methyltransferase, partial [Chromatiales bacterium]|nr:methyltransferase [Chromatiales bacterium]
MSAAIANTDVRAPLRFIVPQETKPYYDSSAATGGEPVIYFETEYRDVDISDIRAKAQEPTLDKEGFCLKHAPTGVANLHDDGVVSAQYEPELCELLKTFTGADRVGVFDYTRRSDDSAGASNADGKRGPASRVHVDYTVASGPKRARDALGERVFEEVIES